MAVPSKTIIYIDIYISFLEPGWQEVQEDDFGCGDKTTPFLILGQLKRRSRAENENNLR